MAQNIMNNFSPDGGSTTFTIQDARVDDIKPIIDNTNGKFGIEVRDKQLQLSNGGYYEDGVALEDTSGATANNSAPGETTFDIIFTIQDEVDNLISGVNVSMFLGYSVEDEYGESDSVILDLSGNFQELVSESGEFYFVPDGERVDYTDNYIKGIKLAEDRDWEITITFAKSLASVQIDEIDVYTINTLPVQWPADLVDFDGIADIIGQGITAADGDGMDNLYGCIVARLISEGYIQSQL